MSVFRYDQYFFILETSKSVNTKKINISDNDTISEKFYEMFGILYGFAKYLKKCKQ